MQRVPGFEDDLPEADIVQQELVDARQKMNRAKSEKEKKEN